MRKCTLKILTQSDGNTTAFESAALFEEGASFDSLHYQVEGDEGILLIGDDGVTMTRRGSVEMKMLFRLNQRTELLLLGEGCEGKIPLNTREYRRQKADDKISIQLCYELFQADHIQIFSQDIQIVFSEEK